jgi:ABC-type antimicrobial peptide transport system permease subunit
MAIPLAYNVRSVFQRPIATATTAVGIGLTVTIFIGALALASGFRAALVSTGSPDNVIVLRKGADSEISSGISHEAAAILRAHPAVAVGAGGAPLASAELVVVTNKERLGQKGSSNLTVRGVETAAFALHGPIEIVEGRLFAFGTDEVVVGQRIAGRFANCAVGDRIRFGQHAFTVVGHFAAGGSAFESEIWGDAAVLMPALDREGVFQSVFLTLRDPASLARVRRELEEDPRLPVQVQGEPAFYGNQSELLTSLIRVLGVLLTGIMALGAVFGAMNTMYAAVASRTREIGTLLVLGFRPGAVLASFVFESIFVALLGGALGCLLALPIHGITTSTTNFQSFSEVAFAFRVTPDALAAGMICAALLGLVGGFLPALRAARRKPAVSLRGE